MGQLAEGDADVLGCVCRAVVGLVRGHAHRQVRADSLRDVLLVVLELEQAARGPLWA